MTPRRRAVWHPESVRPLPTQIAAIAVPHDPVSATTWQYAQRILPEYLLLHSVRSYCWGATIGAAEGWSFDRQVLWTATLLHDQGLTTLPRNDDCFEIAGGARARRWLERAGMAPEAAQAVERAIVLHMQPSVTLDDGPEAVLLDRATSIDVRGDGFELIDAVRSGVVRDYPRGDFDRFFLAAIRREVGRRSNCQSSRLLNETGLADWMVRSPWKTAR
jgi:HD superfamily phosphodiesterase